MQLYSVEKNGEVLFYFIDDESKDSEKGLMTATIGDFESFNFIPLNSISLNADEVIVNHSGFDKAYPNRDVLNFKGTSGYFRHLYYHRNALGILKTLQTEGKGNLHTNEKHLILKVVLGKLLDLGNVLYEKDTNNSFNMPIVINSQDIVKTIDDLLINKFGRDWAHGLNYPSIVLDNAGGRLMLYKAIYFTSLGLDVYDFISQMLKFEIYYHKEIELEDFRKDNEDILKYLKPETYGIEVLSKVKSVYMSFDSPRTPYNSLELSDEVMMSLIKKVISDYYEPIFKKGTLKKILKSLEIPDNICTKKEAKEIVKEIFLALGYPESVLEKANKRKYTEEKVKTKEDILRLMNKVIYNWGEWWQDCGLLPSSEIDNVEFVEWLKSTRPKSYQNASLCAKKDGQELQDLDLDIITAYAVGGTAYLVPDNKKGLKNVDKTKVISVASEYKSRNEEKRQMELVAEYALISKDVLDYLLEVFNEAFD